MWRLNSSDWAFVRLSGVCQATACRRHLQVLHKVAALGVRDDLSAQVMNERKFEARVASWSRSAEWIRVSLGASFRIRAELQSAAAGRTRRLNRASAGLFLLLSVVPTSTLAHGGSSEASASCGRSGMLESWKCVF